MDGASLSRSTARPIVGSTDRGRVECEHEDGRGTPVGGRDTDLPPALRGPEAAAQQTRMGGQRKRKGRQEDLTERRDIGDDGGAAGFLCVDKAARGRLARWGGAKPEEATHRHLDYITN
jgi:hypothetical protein